MRDILIAPKATGPLGPVVTRLDTVIRCLCAAILWLGFVGLFGPTLVNATLRYALNTGFAGSEQMVQLVFPWFIVGGATLAAQHGRHIKVVFFSALLPSRAATAVRVLAELCVIGAAAVVIRYGMEITLLEGGTYFTLIGVAQAWSYAALPAGYALLILTALSSIYRLLRGEIFGPRPEDLSLS